MMDENTPILVGCGQVTVRDEPLDALSTPMDLMRRAAGLAAADAGLGGRALAELDALVVVKSFREPMRNSPEVLARHLGATRARCWLTPNGGSAPQALVNLFAEQISRGEAGLVLLAGAEAIDNARRLIKAGEKPRWSEPSDNDPEVIFTDRPMWNDYEERHGVWLAAHVYPMLETAYRAHLGRTIEAHQRAMGRLFERFTEVAASAKHAWFPTARSAEEIATAGSRNRFVGWPYTKLLCAMNQINQSAALLLTSVGRARALGIPRDRWIFLHGCAEASDTWLVSERPSLHDSPAIRLMGEKALEMAGRGIEEIDLIDIYSCFPVAVEVARDALGIPEDDPRHLTVTGGLPFHGGAGNNYSMNAIATMMDRLRAEPGKFGLLTANGGYLTKHAAGIYSSDPGPWGGGAHWRREDPASYQAMLDAVARPRLVERPEGEGWIEAYTVTFGRAGEPERGILIGRLGEPGDANAPRFIANTPADPELLSAMTQAEYVGRTGRAVPGADGINLFHPNG